MRELLVGLVVVVGCGGLERGPRHAPSSSSSSSSSTGHVYACACSAICDGDDETIPDTECGASDDAIDELVAEATKACGEELVARCAAYACGCRCRRQAEECDL